MKTFKYILISLMLIAFSACNNNSNQTTQSPDIPGIHEVVVKEVLQASAYTYLNVEEGGSTYWMAVTKIMANPGDTYIYTKGMEMKNFESKDLERTFESVWFVGDLRAKSESATPGGDMPPSHPTGKKDPEKKEIAVTPAEDGISISDLYANAKKYNGKEVTVKGEVVKVNTNIMKMNWVHIQDGTNHDGDFDLTITTDELVFVGDVVTFKGKIALDKDFGSGYSYKLIMEEAFQPSLR